MTDLAKEFERLIIAYSHAGACWWLGCTTCGCMHIRSAFKHLDELPDELSVKQPPAWDWSPHEAPRDEFVLAAAECNMERLNQEAKFNDWLGLLGVCMADAEQSNAYATLVKKWGEAFTKLDAPLFTERWEANGKTFGWRDLELVEKSIVRKNEQAFYDMRREENDRELREARAAYRASKAAQQNLEES